MNYFKLPETETFDQWENRMAYHPPTDSQVRIYEENRRRFIELARYLFDTLPPSEERKRALWQLNEALKMANQTVAVVDVISARPQ